MKLHVLRFKLALIEQIISRNVNWTSIQYYWIEITKLKHSDIQSNHLLRTTLRPLRVWGRNIVSSTKYRYLMIFKGKKLINSSLFIETLLYLFKLGWDSIENSKRSERPISLSMRNQSHQRWYSNWKPDYKNNKNFIG